MKARTVLPEVTLLHDARDARPENAVGVGDLWYEPEVWTLPFSFLKHGQINRKDLRNILKDYTDEEISRALADLVRHNILDPSLDGYVVRSVQHFEG
jgi:hypothetical protein